jgi:hypothetical protein
MSGYDLHSLILACDFGVDDVDQMWKWLKKHEDGLASIGAHHVVRYTSIWEPRRVLATMGNRHARSIRDVLRSPAIFEWFSISGADDIPPIFGGEVVEKLERFKGGGVRKIWVYQALDEVAARQWIDHPDAAAEWMSTAGLGAYPTQFVGRYAHLMTVGEKV